MKLDLLLKNFKFFPIILLLGCFNIVPLFFIIVHYIELGSWRTNLQDVLIFGGVYLFIYGCTYVIGAFTLDLKGADHYKSARQSILHMFTIVRLTLILFFVLIITYTIHLGKTYIFLILVGSVFLILAYQMIRKLIMQRRNINH